MPRICIRPEPVAPSVTLLHRPPGGGARPVRLRPRLQVTGRLPRWARARTCRGSTGGPPPAREVKGFSAAFVRGEIRRFPERGLCAGCSRSIARGDFRKSRYFPDFQLERFPGEHCFGEGTCRRWRFGLFERKDVRVARCVRVIARGLSGDPGKSLGRELVREHCGTVRIG